MSNKSLFPGRQPAHPVGAASIAQQQQIGIGAIGWTVVVVSSLGAHIAGGVWALSRTSAYALDVLVFAAVMSAFEVRARSRSAERGGVANHQRRHWLPEVVRATAVAASVHVLYDAASEQGMSAFGRLLSALGRLIAPAGASPGEAGAVGVFTILGVGVLIFGIVQATRALREKLRQ